MDYGTKTCKFKTFVTKVLSTKVFVNHTLVNQDPCQTRCQFLHQPRCQPKCDLSFQASKEKKTQKEIGDIAGVAEVTIKQAYKLMLPGAKDLFPESFQFEVPVEHLPSS